MEHFKKDHWDQHSDEIIKLQAVSTADQMQVSVDLFCHNS